MSRFIVSGGNHLEGELTVQGSKNAVLPILAATVITNGKNIIHNCPDISDVDNTINVLENLGCKVIRTNNTVAVDSSCLDCFTIPDSLMRNMRSSIMFLGAILARCHQAKVSMPGGCEIGLRPIDLHIKALQKLGVKIEESYGYINCSVNKLTGARIHLDFPSVGATENVMLAASVADGITILENAACEPEILDLQKFLNRMGAKISGAGTGIIQIEGVSKLYGVEHTVMPDRIVASTYLIAVAAAQGKIVLKSSEPAHMGAVIDLLSYMGCDIQVEKDRIYLCCNHRLNSIPTVKTMPYPGFPTDIQSPFTSLASIADGTSLFVENIFENRFQHIDELVRMGADIKIDGRCAVIIGKEHLTSANVVAKELRGGAALVIAALTADGTTSIDNIKYIDRGYEHFDKNLALLGANIIRKD